MSSQTERRQPLPSRNPIPLSAAQERQMKELYHRRVRNYCTEEIKEFAECVRGRTITATWACRIPKIALNSCIVSHSSIEEEDRAREEYFANAPQRRAQRADDERKLAAHDRFHREWWDADKQEASEKRK